MHLRVLVPSRVAAPAVLATALALLPVWAATPAAGAPGAGAGSEPVATPGDVWTVPSGYDLRITGRGYGHGRGMSQYGAEGAARAGLTHQQINEFYYPGTQWGTVSGRVRVHITADTTDDLVVQAGPAITVKDLATKRTWSLPQRRARQWRLSTNAGNNKTLVQWRDRGAWRRWRTLTGDGEFSAPGGLTLVTPSGSTTYRGKLRAASPTPGSRSRDTVNVLSLENYLKGVVPLEIPAAWSQEAVRAQSVAARTYAAFERAHPLARHYQICDTTQCQVYGGKSAEHPLSNDAVTATAKQVLTLDGEPAFTQFGSSNGGWSAAGSMPYLSAREDPYDGWAGNPVHTWETTVTDARFEAAWPAIGDLQRVSVDSRDGNGEWSGRVVQVTVVGSAGQVTVSGDDVRSALGLRSSWFTMQVVPRTARGAW